MRWGQEKAPKVERPERPQSRPASPTAGQFPDCITASLLYDLYAAMPQPKRPHGVWVMSKETLDRIKDLPEAERSGPVWAEPPELRLFGRPVEIQPDAQGAAFVEREPVPPPVDHGPVWAQALSEKLDEIKALLEGKAA